MVRKEMSRIAREIEARYHVEISWTEEQTSESPATPVTAPVVRLLTDSIATVYGVTAVPVGIGGGTVAAGLRNRGYDAVVWSRMDETAHQPNEYCILENLVGDACVMVAFILGAGKIN
jgi:succinyl-diaminopimelate desuccinylase